MARRSPVDKHVHWGSAFVDVTELPNVFGAAIQNSDLEVGDLAYVIDSTYHCDDETLGAAVWTAVGPTVVDLSFPGIITENCLFVDKGTNTTVDGSAQFPFHALEDAFTAAVALGVQVDIVVLGGTYNLNNALVAGAYQITVHGLGVVSIIRAAYGEICELTASRKVTFRNCCLDGMITVSGTAAELFLDNCKFDGGIEVENTTDADTLIKLNHTDIIADSTVKYPLHVSDTDPKIRIYDSYLEGPEVAITGYPAIRLAEKNDNLVVVQSDLIGYDMVESVLTPCPISATGTPDVVVYHCGLNGPLYGVSNLISTPYNVIDGDIGLPRHKW